MNDEPEGNQSKSRKKKDKRLSQQNKCLNEKRRREQESIYMEELAEYLSAIFGDMSRFPAVKPDRCAILQETVNQIRRIKQEDCGPSDAVQQSQVSSSKPTILPSDVIGLLLLEALDGFLIVVSSQGKVVCVSNNVTQYLKYTQDDLVGKSIYNIIHVGDHAQFSSSLLPMSVGPCVPWQTDKPGGKSRTFNCRMLIKPAGEENDELEVKQQQVSQYENMRIEAILHPYPNDQESETGLTDSENQTCLACIARRISFSEKNSGMLGVEQFTTKQDLKGKILDCDTSGIHPRNYPYTDFISQNIQDFCHVNDVSRLAKHHQEVVKNGSNTSGVYRFKLQENRYVFVQTKSKLFNHPNTNQPEFIMSTHSIVRECDTDTELKGSASSSLMKAIVGTSSGSGKIDLNRIVMGKKSNNPLGLMDSGSIAVGGSPSLNSLNRFLASNPGQEIDFAADSLGDILDLLPRDTLLPAAETVSSASSGSVSAASVTTSVVSSTPVTQVSWSGRTAVSLAQSPGLMRQAQGQLPAGMQGRMGMGMNINKGPISPISPGYLPQRSPGYAAQRSPGFAPSPGAMTPRSKSPATGQMMQQQRTPGLMSPPSRKTSHSSLGGQLTEDDLNIVFDDTREIFEALTSPLSTGTLVSQHGNPSHRQRSFSAHDPMRTHQGAPTTPTWDGNMQTPLKALSALQASAGGGDLTFNQPVLEKFRNSFMNQQNPFLKELYVPVDKGNDSRTKLRQLLTATNSEASSSSTAGVPSEDGLFPQPTNPAPSSNKGKEAATGKQQKDPPSQPQQSPQPGPSPRSSLIPTPSPQQPQSTSADDPDSSSRDAAGQQQKPQRDAILKKLLSQNDDEEEQEEDQPSPGNQQLLNDDQKNADEESDASKTHLLQRLLQQEDDSNDADYGMKAESTSKDDKDKGSIDSVTGLPTTGRPSSSTGSNQSADSSILNKLFNGAGSGSSGAAAGTTSTSPFLGQQKPAPQSQKPKDDLSTMLESMWERGSDPDSNSCSSGGVGGMFSTQQGPRQGIKRKLSAIEGHDSSPDSTEMNSNGASNSSKPSQKNSLLTQLLSKKPSTETVAVNTQTINACATPQTRLPKATKILDIADSMQSSKNNEMVDAGHQEATPGGDMGHKPTPWDNPRTNPDTPFPGNTKDKQVNPLGQPGNVNMMGGQQQTLFSPGHSSMNNASSGLSAIANMSAMAGPGMNNLNPGSNSNPNSIVNSDPALAQILQDAASLNTSAGAAGGASNINFNQPMSDDLALLEQVLNTSEFSELENLLGISNPQVGGFTGEDEQVAIDAIQQQLMNIESTPSTIGTSAPLTGQPALSGQDTILNSSQASTSLNNLATGMPNNGGSTLNSEAQRQLQLRRLQHLQSSVQLPQGLGPNQPPQGGPGFQQQQQQQQNLMGFGHQQQQGTQRFSQPQNAQGMNSPPAMPSNQQQMNNVRQTLLLKQRQKQAQQQQQQQHQQQQQQRQEQDRQRLLLQQQQQLQQRPPFGQFGPQGNLPQGIDRMQSPGGIPENFNELMNTSMAPNVSLQRNQSVPGPMSPRFQQQGQLGGQQQQAQQPNPAQQQNLSQMLRGSAPQQQSNRMSPFGSQTPGTPNQPQMYTQRPNPAMMAGGAMTQLGGNNLNTRMGLLNQNMGGLTRQNSQDGNQFQFPGTEQPFPGAQGGQANQMGMISPQANQQQALLAQQQNRLMQARAMGNMGMTSPQMSPRGGQQASPFVPGGGQGVQDQHLMSPQPQKHSPGSAGAGQQLTPPFSAQGAQYSQAGFTSPVMSAAGQQNFNPLASASPLTPDSLFSPTGQLQPDRKAGMAQPPVSTTQYVKQELRALCNTRSQNQTPSTPSGSNTDILAELDLGTTSEIPMDLFEQINELTKVTEMNKQQQQQQSHMGGNQGPQPMQTDPPVQEDNVLSQSRMEAHRRFQKFQQLSFGAAPKTTVAGAEARATNLFRNQLIHPPPQVDNAGNGSAQGSGVSMNQPAKGAGGPSIQVVQTEPRPQVDDIKPADQRNSLLSKLLSDS